MCGYGLVAVGGRARWLQCIVFEGREVHGEMGELGGDIEAGTYRWWIVRWWARGVVDGDRPGRWVEPGEFRECC